MGFKKEKLMNVQDFNRMALQTTGTETIGLQGNAGVLHCTDKIHERGLRRTDKKNKRGETATP